MNTKNYGQSSPNVLLLLLIIFFFSQLSEAGELFTKISATGIELSDNASEWSCVKHKVTGQIWEVKTTANKDDKYTFDKAPDYAAQVNSQGLCGHNDWRVPTIKELNSITDKTTTMPAIDISYFPNNHPSYYYWSASSYADSSSFAWVVGFNNGYSLDLYKGYIFYVRLVREGQSFDFFDYTKLDISGNDLPDNVSDWSCIRDNRSGLIWEVKTTANKDDKYTFDNALNYAAQVNEQGLCGFNDWRLPDIDELVTLVDYSVYSPSIQTNWFPNTISLHYWSALPFANSSGFVWNVLFGVGSSNYFGKSRDYVYVRLVREGQSFASSTTPTVTTTTITITTPSRGATYKKGDKVTLKWSTQNSSNNAHIVISMKRDSASSLTAPDNKNWYRFSVFSGAFLNDGNETITIPDFVSLASDWRFFVRFENTDIYDAVDTVFTVATSTSTSIVSDIKQECLTEGGTWDEVFGECLLNTPVTTTTPTTTPTPTPTTTIDDGKENLTSEKLGPPGIRGSNFVDTKIGENIQIEILTNGYVINGQFDHNHDIFVQCTAQDSNRTTEAPYQSETYYSPGKFIDASFKFNEPGIKLIECISIDENGVRSKQSDIHEILVYPTANIPTVNPDTAADGSKFLSVAMPVLMYKGRRYKAFLVQHKVDGEQGIFFALKSEPVKLSVIYYPSVVVQENLDLLFKQIELYEGAKMLDFYPPAIKSEGPQFIWKLVDCDADYELGFENNLAIEHPSCRQKKQFKVFNETIKPKLQYDILKYSNNLAERQAELVNDLEKTQLTIDVLKRLDTHFTKINATTGGGLTAVADLTISGIADANGDVYGELGNTVGQLISAKDCFTFKLKNCLFLLIDISITIERFKESTSGTGKFVAHGIKEMLFEHSPEHRDATYTALLFLIEYYKYGGNLVDMVNAHNEWGISNAQGKLDLRGRANLIYEILPKVDNTYTFNTSNVDEIIKIINNMTALIDPYYKFRFKFLIN